MKSNYYGKFILLVFFHLLFFAETVVGQYPAGSPVAINGKLKIVGNKLSNECGNAVQLRGMSSHGVQWFPQCYSSSSLDALVKDWKIDIFRIAMYVGEGGYTTKPDYWKTWIDGMVDECAKRGIYCLIDWHVLTPGDPNANISAARDFWTYMSNKHKGKKHVLYEICNEPNGVDWAKVKTYANDIIPRIRANDPSTIIIVGTPTWSQDVDIAAGSPISGQSNIMYTLHFYSGSHSQSLRDKANTALSKGVALFVTEFGVSQASGDGGPYLSEADTWMSWMQTNKISWVMWSFADKAEVSAALSANACSSSGWNNTTQAGTWVKQKLSNPADNFNCSGTGNNNPQPPAVSINAPASASSFNAPAKITITANASDPDGSISKVEFYNGSNKIGEDATSPYSYEWTNVAAGSYSITAKATDNSGTSSTSSAVSVTVKANQVPVVSITSPANGNSLKAPATVKITASASDGDGSITKVEFFNGDNKIGESTSSPYTYTWSNVAAGTYSITAKATDNGGSVTTSGAISITVKNNVAPKVSITSPVNGEGFKSGNTITISADATDEDGTIAKVEFFNGSNKLGESTTSPFKYTWSNVQSGSYSITAKATDDSGGSSTSSPASINVTNVTGTEDLYLHNHIKVFPNPADKEFTIVDETSGVHGETKYELLNSVGQIVWSDLAKDHHALKVSSEHFKKGMYTLRVERKDKMAIFKIVLH